MNQNLYELFAARFPTGKEIFLRPAHASPLRYSDLPGSVARLANVLVALGAKPGDRVAAQVEKSTTGVLLYLACLRAGCVYLPLNPAYQAHELAHLLSDADPSVVVAAPATAPMMRTLCSRARVVELANDGSGELTDLAAAQADVFQSVYRSSTDLAAILYTSGTTGLAKGAMLTHGNLQAGVRALHGYWQFEVGDVLLHILPIFHFHGLFVALHCALWNGSEVLFESRFDGKRIVELLTGTTVLMGVPTHYVRLLAEPGLSPEACHTVRLFVSGSAPLLPETFESFRKRTGHVILERYGMTEGGMFTSNPYDGERRCGTVGFALPGVSVRLVDADGNPVGAEVTGGIEVKGANVFAGYWQLPDKTAAEFTPDGFFKTGDLGRFDADGYLSIVGRNKDLIISGGLNIYPKEIEEFIDRIDGVLESAVVGIEHPDFGEAVIAVVVRDPASPHMLDESSIIERVKGGMARFKVPKAVHFLDELPRNAMGKVQKNVLRDGLTNRADAR